MRVLHWRPCPFFCPERPDYFRSWADMMTAAANRAPGEVVAIDVPESVPLPRGLHDLSGIYVEVTPDNGVHFHGDDPWRTVQVVSAPKKPYTRPTVTAVPSSDPRAQALFADATGLVLCCGVHWSKTQATDWHVGVTPNTGASLDGKCGKCRQVLP